MVWLIPAVVLWGIIHSSMASLAFKGLLRRILGAGFMRFYRLLYNSFSAVSLAPILYLMAALPNQDLYRIPAPWSVLMLAGQGISTLLLFITVLQTDILSFIGLRQVIEEEKPGRLVTGGFYRAMRHPLYTFGLLVLWLSPAVTINSFIVYVSLTLYILVGAYFEERKLLREFGRQYADYRSVTPMIVPRLRFGGNKR